MEINEFNFLLTKEIQINFACVIFLLPTVRHATIAHLKSQSLKIRCGIVSHLTVCLFLAKPEQPLQDLEFKNKKKA